MQPFNYVIMGVLALLLTGAGVVVYRQSKKPNASTNYYPYTPNKAPTIGSGYAATSPAKGPGCGCGKSK